MEIKLNDLIDIFVNFNRELMVPLFTGAISDPVKYEKNVIQLRSGRTLLDKILAKLTDDERAAAKEYIEKEFINKGTQMFLTRKG